MTEAEELPAVLRDYATSDRAFVVDSWRESDMWRAISRSKRSHATPWDREAWRAAAARRAERVIDAGAHTIVVAGAPGDADTIAGWAIGGPDCLLYVYVRAGLRGAGIARAMIAALGNPPAPL